MTAMTLLAYIAALFIAAATPGPAMLAVITTGLSRNTRSAMMVGLGIAIADVALVVVVLAGLAIVATAFGWVFTIVKYAGAAYLVWIGIRMWRASAAPLDEAAGARSPGRSFLLGAGIAFGNPKAILFHASLMPLLIDIHEMTTMGAFAVVASVLTVNLAVMGFYALVSGRASSLFLDPLRRRFVNRAGGAAMIGTGAIIAAR